MTSRNAESLGGADSPDSTAIPKMRDALEIETPEPSPLVVRPSYPCPSRDFDIDEYLSALMWTDYDSQNSDHYRTLDVQWRRLPQRKSLGQRLRGMFTFLYQVVALVVMIASFIDVLTGL